MNRKSFASLVLFACVMLFAAREAQAFYNPSTGRWLSRDPIGESGGLNQYGMVSNDLLNRTDYVGLTESEQLKAKSCSKCCECAVAISIVEVNNRTHPMFNFPSTFFGVNIYLEYHPSTVGGSATFKWEENSNKPPKHFQDKGAKPDQWYDTHELDPGAGILDPGSVSSNWRSRNTSCDPPVGRIVLDYDEPGAQLNLGYRVIHFRLTIVNPKNCECEKDSVSVTAVQVIDPKTTPPQTFQTPDPNSPP